MQDRRRFVLPVLAALAGIMMLSPPPTPAQGAGQGTIEGTVWRETGTPQFPPGTG